MVAVIFLTAFGRSDLFIHDSFDVNVLEGVIVGKSMSTTYSKSAAAMIYSMLNVWNTAVFYDGPVSSRSEGYEELSDVLRERYPDVSAHEGK